MRTVTVLPSKKLACPQTGAPQAINQVKHARIFTAPWYCINASFRVHEFCGAPRDLRARMYLTICDDHPLKPPQRYLIGGIRVKSLGRKVKLTGPSHIA